MAFTMQPVYAPGAEQRVRLHRAKVQAVYGLGVTADSEGHTPEFIDAAAAEAFEMSRHTAAGSTPHLGSASATLLSEEIQIECEPEGGIEESQLFQLPIDDFAEDAESELRASINKLSKTAEGIGMEATGEIQQCFDAIQVLRELCRKQSEWIEFYGMRAVHMNALFEAQSAHESDTESSISTASKKSIPQKGGEEKSEDSLASYSLAPVRSLHASEKRQPQLAKECIAEMPDTGSDEHTEVRRASPRPFPLQRLEHSLKTVQTDIAALKVEHEHVTDEHLLDADKLKHEWEQRADSGERTEERRALLPPLRARRRSSGVRDADINDGSGFFDALCARNGCF